jgi:DNA ligase-1
LSYRSKKSVEIEEVKIRVGVYAFDLMFFNGKVSLPSPVISQPPLAPSSLTIKLSWVNNQSLISLPFRQRRDLLRSRFTGVKPDDIRLAVWDLIPSSDNNELPALQNFFAQSLEMRAEGIMVKLLDEAEIAEEDDDDILTSNHHGDDEDNDDSGEEEEKPKKSQYHSKPGGQGNKKILPSTYEPDRRSDAWLKVKNDYLDNGGGDSLDLVPIAAWHGSGRKKDFWSPILLACFDEESQTFSAVTKVMSGFTDDFCKFIHLILFVLKAKIDFLARGVA